MKVHQGKGYAKEAAAAVLGYGLEIIGLEKVVCLVHPENMVSLSIIKGLGINIRMKLRGLRAI
jgi:[ribosomal protein S5]-alanine N-acetyltransferase